MLLHEEKAAIHNICTEQLLYRGELLKLCLKQMYSNACTKYPLQLNCHLTATAHA